MMSTIELIEELRLRVCDTPQESYAASCARYDAKEILMHFLGKDFDMRPYALVEESDGGYWVYVRIFVRSDGD